VGVNHRRADVAVAQQILDGADGVPVLEQVGRERVSQTVTRRPLGDTGPLERGTKSPLHDGLMQMMPAPLAGLRLQVLTHRAEHPLPTPLGRSPRILALNRLR